MLLGFFSRFFLFLGIYTVVYGIMFLIYVLQLPTDYNMSDTAYIFVGSSTFAASVISAIVVIITIKETSKKYLIGTIGNELDNEFNKEYNTNIHHELSTPIMLLENSFYNITELSNIDINKDIKEQMNIFKQSHEQVMSILAKSSAIKECRVVPKASIYDLIRTAFDSLSLAYEFKFEISSNLHEIGIKRAEKFNNSDFINVLFALIKNSLEAGASDFLIKDVYTLDGINLLIMDNGNGIRNRNNKIIESSEYEKIFGLNYSTKDKQGKINKYKNIYEYLMSYIKTEKSTRGVGLWLNKTLLGYNHINLSLQKTSKEGTIFKIEIPKRRTYEYKKNI